MLREEAVTVNHLNSTYSEGRAYLKTTPFHESLDTAKKYIAHGPAVTLFLDDKLVAVIGIVLSSPGVGAAWARVTDHVDSCPLQFTRYVQRFIDEVAMDYNLRRIEALVDSESNRALRWITWLGFEIEGLLRKINSDGSDSYLVAAFPEFPLEH